MSAQDMVVVVGWTPDAYGEAALQRGIVEARLRGGRVVAVNATRGDSLVDERFANDEQLDRLRSSVADSEVAVEVRSSMGPDVGDQVLDVAGEVDADLIVLGLRRRTPVGKLIMGSVAQRVLLGAECAVLAVKPPR